MDLEVRCRPWQPNNLQDRWAITLHPQHFDRVNGLTRTSSQQAPRGDFPKIFPSLLRQYLRTAHEPCLSTRSCDLRVNLEAASPPTSKPFPRSTLPGGRDRFCSGIDCSGERDEPDEPGLLPLPSPPEGMAAPPAAGRGRARPCPRLELKVSAGSDGAFARPRQLSRVGH